MSTNFINDFCETEIFVNLLQKCSERNALIQNLFFRAKDVSIILGETPNTHDAVQATGGLVTMAVSKLTIPQRQISITLNTLLINQNMPRAIHWLKSVLSFFRFRDEHVFTVFIPVAGLFPQSFIDNLWTFDLLITIVSVDLTQVLLNTLP